MWCWLVIVLAVGSIAMGQDFLEDLASYPDIVEELKLNPNIKNCIPTLKMTDASGKLPAGILEGNLIDLGSFTECLHIENYNNITEQTTYGKYCMVKITLPLGNLLPSKPTAVNMFNIQPHVERPQHRQKRMILQGIDGTNSSGLILGWCVPNTCPFQDFTKALSEILNKANKDLNVVPLLGGMCQTKDNLVDEFTINDILLITFFSLTLLLVALSTIYDIYISHYSRRPAHLMYLAFSLKTNGQKLLSVSNNSDQLGCLYGLRFISMLWVMYGHKYLSTVMGPIMNLLDFVDWLKDPANMYLLNATVSVDTFFVLSGLLVSYIFCLAMDKGIKFNVIMFYIHRYLRLTPVLAVVVWSHTSLLKFFGSGPFWPLSKSLGQDCVDYWWAPLIYIQNYYNYENVCISTTWYLSVDMQLFVLSPLLLIPLSKWPKYTMAACTVLLLVSMVIPFTISYVYDLKSLSIQEETATSSMNYMKLYYFATHCRYGPWLMGFMLGYYLFKLKNNVNHRVVLHRIHIIFGWMFGLGILFVVLYAGHDLMLNPTKIGNAFFNAMMRHAWALGVCWVIYACTQGYGGPINAFLSWSVFQVLSKFTYTMYLIHLTIMLLVICDSKTLNFFTDFNTMSTFWGDFMLSLAIAVCLTLAYESPMVTIEKILLGRGENERTQVPEVTTTNGVTNRAFEEER